MMMIMMEMMNTKQKEILVSISKIFHFLYTVPRECLLFIGGGGLLVFMYNI
jgi:hypothetical protein